MPWWCSAASRHLQQAYISRGVENSGCSTWPRDPEFALALMRKITDLMKASVIRLLEEAGDYIDVLDHRRRSGLAERDR